MARWMDCRSGDITLRITGSLLLLSAWYEGGLLKHLMRMHGPAQATMGELGLASILFLSTSFGLALLILGRHLGDRIAVSERWTKLYSPKSQHDQRLLQGSSDMGERH